MPAAINDGAGFTSARSNVGTEQVQAGRARLRLCVVTENVIRTVRAARVRLGTETVAEG